MRTCRIFDIPDRKEISSRVELMNFLDKTPLRVDYLILILNEKSKVLVNLVFSKPKK